MATGHARHARTPTVIWTQMGAKCAQRPANPDSQGRLLHELRVSWASSEGLVPS